MARAGRKRKMNAKSRATTTEGRGLIAMPNVQQITRKAEILDIRVDPTDTIAVRKLMKMDTSCPLPILLARKVIDAEQFNAGQRFAELYWRWFGEPWPVCRDGKTAAENEERDKILEREFNGLRDVVWSMGRKQYDAFTDVVVDQDWTTWLDRFIKADVESWQTDALFTGLSDLAEYRRSGKKG